MLQPASQTTTVNIFKLTIFLLCLVHGNLALHCKLSQFDRLNDDKWSLDAFKHVRTMYGFPVDFIGGTIGTMLVEMVDCETAPGARGAESQQYLLTTYCQYKLEMLQKHLEAGSRIPQCPSGLDTNAPTLKDKIRCPQFVWTRNIGYPGNYNGYHIRALHAFFNECASSCNGMQRIGGVFMCDLLTYIDVLGTGIKPPEDVISWDQSETNIYDLYLYWFCQVTWPELRRLNPNDSELQLMHLCPNPCSVRASRCARIPNTLQPLGTSTLLHAISESSCIRPSGSLIESEYECLCKPGYRWQKSAKACVLIDLCTEDSRLAKLYHTPDDERLCSPAGTLKCITLESQPLKYPGENELEEVYSLNLQLLSTHQCVCRSGFTGYRCDRQRDACIESEIIGHPPGNSACRTYLGNKCHAARGTKHYHCECRKPWMQNGSLPFSNCYLRRGNCDHIICRNRGTCVESPDRKIHKCLCEYGWRGDECEIRDIRQWLPWSPWSLCSANMCEGSGWQKRTRECRVPVNQTTGLGFCQGNTFELRPCSVGCLTNMRTFFPLVKLLLTFAVCLLLLQLSVGLIFLLCRMEFSS